MDSSQSKPSHRLSMAKQTAITLFMLSPAKRTTVSDSCKLQLELFVLLSRLLISLTQIYNTVTIGVYACMMCC